MMNERGLVEPKRQGGPRLDDLWEISVVFKHLLDLGYSPQQELPSKSSLPSVPAPNLYQWQGPTLHNSLAIIEARPFQ